MAKFQFTKKEFFFAFFGMLRKRLIRNLALISASLTLIVLCMNDQTSIDPILYISGIIVFFGILAAIFIIGFFRLGKVFDEAAIFRGVVQVDFTADGLHYTYEGGAYLIQWKNVTKWAENRNFLYLYEGQENRWMIPKRGIEGAESDLLRLNLSNAKKV